MLHVSVRTYLLDESHCGAKPIDVEILNVSSIELDVSGGRIVPSFQKANDSTLAGTTSTLSSCQPSTMTNT